MNFDALISADKLCKCISLNEKGKEHYKQHDKILDTFYSFSLQVWGGLKASKASDLPPAAPQTRKTKYCAISQKY